MGLYTYFSLVDNSVTERAELRALLFCFPIWNSLVKVPCLFFKTFLICILFKLTNAFLVEK